MMKKEFQDAHGLQCIFTDEGVTFDDKQQEIYMPYGSLDMIRISMLGVLQATSHATACNFAVARADRAEAKEMVKFARAAMETAPRAELQKFDHSKDERLNVSADLSPEEQLRRYKQLFVQGAISKAEYDLKKQQLK